MDISSEIFLINLSRLSDSQYRGCYNNVELDNRVHSLFCCLSDSLWGEWKILSSFYRMGENFFDI